MDRHISIAELEEKLEARDKENNRLRQNIRLKDSELAQLQDKCNEKSDKIGKLETKHGMVSAQVKQLKGMVETRFPDEMEDGLMEKTLLAAEATHQAERLEEKLKKTKIEREALREEIQSLIKQNDALSQKLHKTIASHERLRQERNMNNKVFLELDDVVTTLDNISLESGDDVLLEDENDNVSIKNIRRKIQAIENDRQRVIKQCKNLEEETIFKDAKISSMESKYYNHGNDRGIRTDTFRPHGSVRMDRKNDYGDSSRRPLIEEEDRSEYSSDSSAIEAPHVSLEVYAEIKKEYESTLREMVKLTEELQTSKSSLRGYEQSTNETENRFTELSDEYKEALLELSNMRRDIDKSEIRLQGALAAKEDMKNAYDSRLTEMSDAYEYLEENYNKLKDDQNEKLANLEKEVSNSEKFFENECMRLKKENQGNTQVLMYTEKKRFEDLRLDNESLVEAQGRLKEELVRLKEKYDKSLKKIVYLEESVKEEKQITEQTMLNSSQESTIRYNTLKKDYNALLVAQESAGNSVTGYYQKLEYHCQSLEGKLRNTKDEADARYQELRDCYESALSTIDKLEMKLADAEERTKRENNQKKAKSKYDIAFDRIADLERDLMSDKGDAVKFEKLKYDSSTLQNTVFEGQDGAGIKDAISVGILSIRGHCNILI
jgi:chromosome segregation ATPase